MSDIIYANSTLCAAPAHPQFSSGHCNAFIVLEVMADRCLCDISRSWSGLHLGQILLEQDPELLFVIWLLVNWD